jgi:hypothetical protein
VVVTVLRIRLEKELGLDLGKPPRKSWEFRMKLRSP